MSLVPAGLNTSLHGRRLGLNEKGRLVSESRDVVYTALRYANVAPSSVIANSNVEAAFDTKFTLKANSLQPGERIKIKFQGIATATHTTDTLAINLRIGGVAGTVLLVLAARDVANNDIFYGEFDLIIRTVGANGTFVGVGVQTASPNAAGTALISAFKASTAIDTTVNQDIVVSAVWSVADVGNSARLDFLTVDAS